MNDSLSRITRNIALVLLAVPGITLPTHAADADGKVTELLSKGDGAIVATPVFSQVVAFSYPPEFRPAFENATPASYIQESVPKGESVKDWSQMITLNGIHSEVAGRPNVAQTLLLTMADEFSQKCPGSLATKGMGKVNISGHEGFVAVIACGKIASKAPHSETALIIVVKGAAEIYLIQWAERGAPVEQAPVLDEAKWKGRFQQLLPIKICDRVPGESAPYPSCVNQQ